MSEVEENHDVFSDESDTTTTATSEADIGADKDAQQEAETQTEARSGDEDSEQQGEKETAEPPAADGDKKVSKSEKMIPESRFKAALKDVTDERDSLRQKLASNQPVPDKEKDPEGFALHNKVEASKRLATRVYKDYDEKIAHYNEMVKTNPTLNKIISEDDAPAIMAYDLATKDMELKELAALKDDPEFQEFKEWKKSNKSKDAKDTQLDLTTKGNKAADVATKVPNLNRTATAVTRDVGKNDNDSLWDDHYSQA